MTPKPIIFLAFANDKEDNARYLRNLNKELHEIEDALKPIKDQFEVIHYEGITLKVLFDRFQEYKERIVIFHYGGHADGYQLLLESWQHRTGLEDLTGGNKIAYGKGLINFLATFKDSLKLVFFNGCTTENLAQDLSAAGLPAVIGTESTINDEVATRLAIRFYNGLANDHTIENAWKQAVGEIEASYNTEAGTRGLFRKGVEKEPTEVPWKMYCTDKKTLDWKLEKVANKNYNVEIETQNIKINVNMDLEEFKNKMNELLDEREFDEFFIEVKNCNFKYNKPSFSKLKEEYTDGEKSTQFVKRLKVFVSDLKVS